MFRITRLTLEGPFRAAAHDLHAPPRAEVDFPLLTPKEEPTDLALFGGYNGTGKTMVLRGILRSLGLAPSGGMREGHLELLDTTTGDVHRSDWNSLHDKWTVTSKDGQETTPLSPPEVPVIYIPAHRDSQLTRVNQIKDDAIPRVQAMWDRLHPRQPAQIGVGPEDLSITDCHGTRNLTKLGSADLELLLLAGKVPEEFDGLLLIDTPELHMFGPYETGLGGHLRWIAPKAQIILATNCGPLWDQSFSFQRFLLSRQPSTHIHVLVSGEAKNPKDSRIELERYLDPGFGGYTILHNGKEIQDIQAYFGVDPTEIRLLDVEHKAAHTEGTWSLSISAALWNATWERREDGWFCTESGPGFA